MTAGTVILGIGSPFGDDRIGWEAAEAIREAPWYRALHPRIRALALDRPGIGLLDELTQADLAIVIDAMRTGADPGTIRRLVPEDLDFAVRSCSGHDAGVIDAVHLGLALGMLPKRIAVFGIEATESDANLEPDPMSEPSPRLRAALPSLVTLVHEEILSSG